MDQRKEIETFQASLKVLMRRGTKVLLLRTKRNHISLPGGRIDKGEYRLPLEKIIEREIKEELGSEARYRLGRPLFQYRRYNSRTKTAALVTVYDGIFFGGRIILSPEHVSYNWVDINGLVFNIQDFGADNKEKLYAFERYFEQLKNRQKRFIQQKLEKE